MTLPAAITRSAAAWQSKAANTAPAAPDRHAASTARNDKALGDMMLGAAVC